MQVCNQIPIQQIVHHRSFNKEKFNPFMQPSYVSEKISSIYYYLLYLVKLYYKNLF